MTTTRDIVSSALKRISILGAGENLTAEDAVDGVRMLNQLLSSWSTDGTVIFSKSLDTKVLSSGVQTYTMGTGGDINTTRPVAITQATVTLGVIQYPLNIWSQNAISTLSFPTLPAAIPSDLYVNNGNPLLTLYLYPAPASGLTLNIYSLKPLSALTINQELDLPPGYEWALINNLATVWAPDFDREASQSVKDAAHDSLQAIKRNNAQYSPPTMAVDSILLVDNSDSGNWFNIYGGIYG